MHFLISLLFCTLTQPIDSLKETKPDSTTTTIDTTSPYTTSPQHTTTTQQKKQQGHWGYALSGFYGIVPKGDKEIKRIVKHNRTWTIGAQLMHTPLPSDGNPYDEDYNYPTMSVGFNYNHYQRVDLHRDADNYDFGLAQPVDYMSHLGNVFTIFGAFDRPLLRHPQKWQFDYSLQFGVGYTPKKYNPVNNVDNEMISTHFLIYCGLGVHATYALTPEWGLRTGLEFQHHSNGALSRPNKGSNAINPMIGLVYRPYVAERKQRDEEWNSQAKSATKGVGEDSEDNYHYDYLNFSIGVGAKALYEEWVRTQFEIPPGEPEYQTDHFKTYMAYSLRMDYMRRWARRWATGVGVDVLYGSYSDRVREIDEEEGFDLRHSPWSFGISVKHEAFYKRISCAMSFGLYLDRHMGHSARRVEQPFYETVGLRYDTGLLDGLKLGFNVKAHAFKADFTELVVALPFRIRVKSSHKKYQSSNYDYSTQSISSSHGG